MATTLERAIASGALSTGDDTAIFYDLSRLDAALAALRMAFPATALHAVAVKANPSVEVLRRIRQAGLGAEVASTGELRLAMAAGFPADRIVFDSPVKTGKELEVALTMGIRINANTLEELARISRLYSAIGSRSLVGVRINPETGKGSIATTSVAAQRSKFGVPLRESRAALISAFRKYPWLAGLHVHIGSQGMSLDQLLDGVAAAYDLFTELRDSSTLRFFDVGGGLPTQYHQDERFPGFTEYATALARRCPLLFTPDLTLITEFGRSVHAGCGWVASRIEYVIEHAGAVSTVLTHVGADMFLRKAYCPDQWHHDMSLCDSSGRLRPGPLRPFSVAGPLCFAGDYLDRNASLPASLREGDYILIHDAGAYTFSMWSMYNSRRFPSIIGYENTGTAFACLRPRQSEIDIVDFWSPGKAT